MYCIDGAGILRKLSRRPTNAWKLECFDDWHFLLENRPWDADEWEWMSRAMGLFELDPFCCIHETDRWRKVCARAYLGNRDPVEAVRAANTACAHQAIELRE